MKYPYRVYLAGKVGKNDWRHSVVNGLTNAIMGPNGIPSEWPILSNAIDGRFDYSGPFFVSCDHGCYHGKNSHGMGADSHIPCGSGGADRTQIAELCFSAINKTDLFFCWLDSADAYGSLVELGYALGRKSAGHQIDIAVYVPKPFDGHRELWFAYAALGVHFVMGTDPITGLRHELAYLGDTTFDSPLEEAFWQEWQESAPDIPIEAQMEVMEGRYRLDFGHVDTKTAIELDGFTYHKDATTFQSDRIRDRLLIADGWTVLRFASGELRANVQRCVNQAADLIRSRQEAAH